MPHAIDPWVKNTKKYKCGKFIFSIPSDSLYIVIRSFDYKSGWLYASKGVIESHNDQSPQVNAMFCLMARFNDLRVELVQYFAIFVNSSC